MFGKFFQKKVLGISIIILLIFGGFLIYKNNTMPQISENFKVQQFETEKDAIKIGVISDTHIPERARFLPGEIKEIFKEVDLIIHGGDIVNWETLKELEEIAPVFAVQGNMDFPEIREKLPAALMLKIFNFKIGIVHSPFPFWVGSHFNQSQEIIAERLVKKESLDILIFGHTHQPYLSKLDFEGKKILLLNPGSPTIPFFSESAVAILTITKESFEGEIIQLK